MGISFCIDITIFVGLLLVDLGANHAVFLPVAGDLVITASGLAADLIAADCRVEPSFKGFC